MKNLKELKEKYEALGREIDALEKKLPNSWNEVDHIYRAVVNNQFNTLTPKRYISLRKLEMLRDIYNDYWRPDWTDQTFKNVIEIYGNEINTDGEQGQHFVLYFKTVDLRTKFLENFRDLIEEAKDLL